MDTIQIVRNISSVRDYFLSNSATYATDNRLTHRSFRKWHPRLILFECNGEIELLFRLCKITATKLRPCELL